MDQRDQNQDQPQWGQQPDFGQPHQYGDQTQQTGPQPGWQAPPTAGAGGPSKKNNTKLGCGCLGALAIVVVIGVAAAVSGGNSSSSNSSSSNTTAPDATYASADALITALGNASLPCTAASPVANSTVTGVTSMTDCDSSTGGGTSDTVVVVLDSHADAQAYAASMLSGGLMSAGGEMVVGTNWAINTAAPYGDQVAQKIGGTVQDAPAAAATTAAAAPATSAAPVKTVVLTKSGEGQSQTKSFTVGDNWSLTYTFDCSNFGSSGNFQVYEDYPNGGALANALAAKGGDTTYQTGDAGTHSLMVNSECDWKITVTDGDTGQ